MGHEAKALKRSFDLHDIGVLQDTPLRGSETILDIQDRLLSPASSALYFFDDLCSEVYIRRLAEGVRSQMRVSQGETVADLARQNAGPACITNLIEAMPHSREVLDYGVTSFIGAPVLGPDSSPIGILGAMSCTPRRWTLMNRKVQEDLAHLVSQEIMLRASFATLRIINQERRSPLN